MILSIITINWNNKAGLQKTMRSVVSQTFSDFEYIVVDGASSDGSVDIIQQYADWRNLKWVSERDNGIYNAMNKGIGMAEGEYLMFLNSGDWLVNDRVVEAMIQVIKGTGDAEIIYGNITKVWPDGRMLKNKKNDHTYTMLSFYRGTLDHVGTCIKKNLFDKYGLYDETLRICSDWSWFLKVVVFGEVKPRYIDLDTVYFDMTGISESGGQNRTKLRQERRRTLEANVPKMILADYDKYSRDIQIMQRLHRHPWAYKITVFIERCLFKWERLKN